MNCIRQTEICHRACILLLFLLILIASTVLICRSFRIHIHTHTHTHTQYIVKAEKNSNIVKYCYNLKGFCLFVCFYYISKYNLFLLWQSWIFTSVTLLQSSVSYDQDQETFLIKIQFGKLTRIFSLLLVLNKSFLSSPNQSARIRLFYVVCCLFYSVSQRNKSVAPFLHQSHCLFISRIQH